MRSLVPISIVLFLTGLFTAFTLVVSILILAEGRISFGIVWLAITVVNTLSLNMQWDIRKNIKRTIRLREWLNS